MNRKAEQWVEQWARIRGQGIWRFIVVRGLFAFGLSFAVFSSLVDFYFVDRTFHLDLFAIRAVVGGLTYGVFGWRWSERRFRKHQDTNA